MLGLTSREVFVYGSNVKGVNGAGGAKAAMLLDKTAQHGIGRGFNGSNTYALLTKILDNQAGYFEKSTGITYNKTGYCSVSPTQIRANIDELYTCALQHPDKEFLITYQFETWPNGTPKKSLNGYDAQEFLEMFVRNDIPTNIVFHESYKAPLEKALKNITVNTPKATSNISDNLIVISPREKAPEGFIVINTTSKDESIGKQFSPFYLSNIELYEGKVAKNMENAWQFSKVYKEFADENENPTKEYFKWAEKGWNDSFAHRYANGKGNIPLYSYWKTFNNKTKNWDEHKWDYVTARKNIYFPLYAKAIANTQAFKDLKARLESGEKIALWDFDGYKHADRNMSYEDVVNSEKYKCGHAFVLYGLLTGQLKLINDELVFDFKNQIQNNQSLNSENKEKEPTYTYFFQATSPFSQWHPALFVYKDLQFICTEQFMMYAKAKTFKDDVVADKILNIEECFNIRDKDGKFKSKEDEDCYNLILDFKEGKIDRTQIVSNYKTLNTWKKVQALIKKLGREVANYNDDVWNQKRVPVVSVGNREKYNQNPDLKEILMATGDSILVEASPYDKIWGIGLDEATAKKTNPSKWPGLNLLGLDVLTNLKEYYRKESVPKSKMKM